MSTRGIGTLTIHGSLVGTVTAIDLRTARMDPSTAGAWGWPAGTLTVSGTLENEAPDFATLLAPDPNPAPRNRHERRARAAQAKESKA